ncbi:MAG: RidA family protein [Chromatiales bacterium]|jgi:2-iminobutanoate/2-iminopropanoate deaminase|nr:RidA family protein [Chromatiales bacterium]
MKRINPDTVHAPLGSYSHTVAVPPNAQWLTIAGQVGIGKNGVIAKGVQKQTDRALRNIIACLRAHDMGPADLVKLTVFLTDARYVGDYRLGREGVLGKHPPPASTLLIVEGLAAPELLVEIEATAAKVV